MQTVDIDNRRENSKNRDIKSQVCGEEDISNISTNNQRQMQTIGSLK